MCACAKYLSSGGSLCLETAAKETAEAQVNMILSPVLDRRAAYSCFQYKGYFLQLLFCDLVRRNHFQIAVSQQGCIIYKSQEGALEQKHLTYSQNVARDRLALGELFFFFPSRTEEFFKEFQAIVTLIR